MGERLIAILHRGVLCRQEWASESAGIGPLGFYKRRMSATPFTKMHGPGNDFVVLDGRARPLEAAGGGVFIRISTPPRPGNPPGGIPSSHRRGP